jgi:hypothetical protein
MCSDRSVALGFILLLIVSSIGCDRPAEVGEDPGRGPSEMAQKLGKYTSVRLTSDLGHLSDNQKRVIALLIEAGQAMDEAFWIQAYGDKATLLDSIGDADARRFVELNYGPWDRLADNEPFIDGVGAKPAGANLYPVDMTEEEFNDAAATAERGDALRSLYTVVRRDDAGELVAVPYREFFAIQVQTAASKLREAAALADNTAFKAYLEMRAEALLTDDYQPSDVAWMDMKDNPLDVVIGPIESYEDQLFGYKASFETFVLVKDTAWSERLSRYAAMLPDLQRGLPVSAEYKREMPGSDADLNAYDAVYFAGDCNAGAKTIAINLPNDEEVQLKKGTRRLQLKNAMRAKFDKILVPVADVLIAEDQRAHVTFDAFFANTMFHEVAHGLGVKQTLDGASMVRAAMKDKASTLEEGKADILGLYMVTKLHEAGELEGAALEDYYVTFLAGIFRSIRFGEASAHGRANMIRFNFFEEFGAFTRDEATGVYRADFEKMRLAIDALSEKILVLQGDGDYAGATEMVERMSIINASLQGDLDRLNDAGIPTDIIFEQGVEVLGLN